ncbi:MAG: ZIP family metal transporter [Nanoarchaeota archaeon]|nr:ZIP family metal transporter [Nanoarchaeota archaeon]
MNALLNSIIATLIISFVSLIGIVTVFLKKKKMENILLWLVGLSAGALIGGAFLHLIPEAAEVIGFEKVALLTLLGFSVFFIIERVLHWRHCHEGVCDIHAFTYMSMIGDSIHNLIDGMIIVAAFLADFKIGIATTIAVITHEIPQELGDFGVLLHGGFSKAKALLFNFLTALTAVLGAIIGYILHFFVQDLTIYVLPFAAGGFIYISSSDLIPELHKEKIVSKSIISFIFFLIGIGLMFGTKMIF